ncbi:hypothetical protein [Flavisolibacter ginsenosidimutans]|uniref:Uncharacterized protein n=1 Tax=Flavisolibacter ginsenosidimutans TaxID=661481 RepID=A0A5B8UNS2_9BACT|nr:hypothetical protein [Flavisolibacter ginsenosidimutans]QEC57710.1 hypothetical protein FSB75_17970 [Flavisolibacter ginsenosidimutans]
MKHTTLLFLFSITAFFTRAQNVTTLPPGKYETRLKAAQNKWEKGDIILLDDSRYKLSSGGETGEYKLSVAAQRIFFTSGPLKSAFTKLSLVNNKPLIVLPLDENRSLGLKAEVWASKE